MAEEVDPDGTLDPESLARAIDSAMKARMARLRLHGRSGVAKSQSRQPTSGSRGDIHPGFAIDDGALWREARSAGFPETLNGLAREIGVAPSTLSRMLRGESQPGAALLACVYQAFGPRAWERIVRVVDPPPRAVRRILGA